MHYHGPEVESPSRLAEALVWLDPQSQRLIELWLMGMERKTIAREMGIDEDTVVAASTAAFQQLRMLLSRR